MLLKYLGSVLPSNDFENKITGIAWSPNNLKLAVATSDRSIFLFDENKVKRDKFSTKPAEAKCGKKSYVIRGIAFSPDSTKIAVGQTDNIVYVYKIGGEWGEKKVICNKFAQSVTVTCIIWPLEGPIVVGLADGKVRAAFPKTHKVQTLYASDSMTIALATNVRGTGFLSSHADGSIIRYYVAEDGSAEASGRIVNHAVPVYALAWPQGHILAAGSDKKIIFYDSRGKMSKIFDYSRDNQEKEMSVACCSPSGQSVAIGSWNKIRIIDWNPRRAIWEETNCRTLTNFYTVTALSWRKDGSRLVIGGLCSAVEMFETILRRTIVRGSHEVAYVGPSQLVVRSLDGKCRPIIIKSLSGNEIDDVRVLGRRDNHVVARTANTLLVSDIELNLLSEIPWEKGSDNNDGNEKFFFEYPGVCLIFSGGELNIVEYGKNEILGSVRTESMNPHVVSVRINERQQQQGQQHMLIDNKRLAYLLDPRTIRIIDFVTGSTICIISHDARIDWLELSETGHRLLFRDKRAKLWLSNDQGERHLLLTNTSFVSWVAGSDVVVAQTGQSLAIWYNVDVPEAVNFIPIRGEAVDIIREDSQTSVIVEEFGNARTAYMLDEALIEFGTALHDNDFGRALLFLENLDERSQVEAMWENVAGNAMRAKQLHIAARCYAALGDVACSKFLHEIIRMNEEYVQETGNDALSNPDFWARLAILNGDLKTAEAIYLEQNELGKALEMYHTYWHWEDALALAQVRGWHGLDELRERHLTWLLDTGQTAKAAAIVESDDTVRAIKLYLEANRAARAAYLLFKNDALLKEMPLVNEIINALKKKDSMELMGQVLEKTGDISGAIASYAQAGVFARAIELARSHEPSMVVQLEKDWGCHLSSAGHYDAAINHFIEAGETLLALNAAIDAHQWRKALEIIRVIEDDLPQVQKQCERLAEYFNSINDRSLAETLFLRAGKALRAVQMHMKVGDWLRAQQVAQQYLDSEEANDILINQALTLEKSGDLRNAEKLYIATGQYDTAINMYKKAGYREDMVRLVATHRPDLLQATHAHLARELEAAGKPREAEQHFLGCGDWRGAVTAYRSCNMWEDALRVAKNVASNDKAAQQVALMWARSLAPELGARLLTRLNYMEPCLQLACEAGLFEWALETIKYVDSNNAATTEQKKHVHYKYAIALEDEGRFEEAEREFILADKATEAVQMYIHNRNWQAAEEVANRTLDQEALVQVLIARAAEAVDAQDYGLAETLLLRAYKPEIIIEHYKKAGMWSEAMRVCREYLPSQEAALRREIGQRSSQVNGNNVFEEVESWLDMGEVRTALDVLILDPNAPRNALIQAAEILQQHAEPELAAQVGGDLGTRLFSIGEYTLAAQVFLQADRLKDAINALAAVGEWDRAQRIVHELAPDLEQYLEEKYKEKMIKEGQIERLAEVDVEAALEVLARKGQWSQLFEKASTHSSTATLHRYIAQRAAQLLKTNLPMEALELYVTYGAPPFSQNYNLYQRLSETVLNSADLNNNYRNLAQLRGVLLELTKHMDSSSDFAAASTFNRFLCATSYMAVRCVCRTFTALSALTVKCSISLLRYSDILLADRCYYEAGMDTRNAGLISEAFVFLNHFLDLEECIEEGNDGGILDVDDLHVTDFPLEVPLPASLSLTKEQREQVKEWVLAISMDQKVEQGLPVDHRGVYVGSLNGPFLEKQSNSPSSKLKALQECCLTGYPIRGPNIQFSENNRVADRDDWNKFVNTARQTPQNSSLNDIIVFIQDWCGTPVTSAVPPVYTF